MRFLIETHHPAHIHFWKYPIRDLIDRGHKVRMIGRDRDVMKRLLKAYDWIPAIVPPRSNVKNRFPMKEMLRRQIVVIKEILRFRPDVVASLMGSYCQSARLLGCRNIIFTDTETQSFNHRIAHPFADHILTPNCFWKPLGSKQVKYRGLHELSFIRNSDIIPAVDALRDPYIVVRLSSWNTMHDVGMSGLGEQVVNFVEWASSYYRILISAEEGALPDCLEKYRMSSNPEDYHMFLAGALLVLTEGASTASEAACLGVPSIYVNSSKSLGYLEMLQTDYGLIQITDGPEDAILRTKRLLSAADEHCIAGYRALARRLHADNPNVNGVIAKELELIGRNYCL